MQIDPRLVAVAEAAGIEMMSWQAELGTRILAGERVVWQHGRRGGMFTVKKLVHDAQARESSVPND